MLDKVRLSCSKRRLLELTTKRDNWLERLTSLFAEKAVLDDELRAVNKEAESILKEAGYEKIVKRWGFTDESYIFWVPKDLVHLIAPWTVDYPAFEKFMSEYADQVFTGNFDIVSGFTFWWTQKG